METNPQDYSQRLSEKYQLQCFQFFQEIMNLQVQIELKDIKIQELETKLAELENEKVDVDSTSNT